MAWYMGNSRRVIEPYTYHAYITSYNYPIVTFAATGALLRCHGDS